MKKFKKTIAFILSVVIMLSVMPFVDAGAIAVTGELTLDSYTQVTIKSKDKMLSFYAPEDGYYKFFSVSNADTHASLFDDEDKVLCQNDDVDIMNRNYNFSLSYKLSGGQTYYLRVGSWDENVTIKLGVSKTFGVQSSEIVQYPDDTTCLEKAEKETMKLDGLKIEYTMTDGTVIDWVYGEDEFMISDYGITVGTEFVENGNLYALISCGEVVDKILYTTVENPVDYITYVGPSISFYENTNGYINEYGDYYYYLTMPQDSYIEVHFKDGTVKTTGANELLDGYWMNCYSNQHTQPWTVGENEVFFSYLGVQTSIKVTMLESLIKNITLNSVPKRQYVYGDTRWGQFVSTDTYEFFPSDITGLSFTVEYVDGTTRTFTDKDFDIETETIDGYEYSVKSCSAFAPKSYTTTFTYMGFELSYAVKVIESPLKDIEIEWYPELTDYQQMFEPVFDGMELKLVYKNGDEKTVVFSDENTSYGDYGYLDYSVDVDGDKITMFKVWDERDEPLYVIRFLDKEIVYSGISFYDDLAVSEISIDSFSFDSMDIDVTYSDGTNETLNSKVVNIYEFGKGRHKAVLKTHNGLVEVDIITLYTDGVISGYSVSALGCKTQVDGQYAQKGDVYLSGDVSILDATKIQKYIAKIENLNEIQLSVADIDDDGEITVMDSTIIQSYIAKLIPKL